ncbi:AraC family transcriptional regulator [Acinetobacter lactucae]|uniref:AraC family transcriptional regulator n=1 Tax=Acinetobacter lactucae TaxID=1785128 RepID=A0A3R9S140_9GAMM|nr:AraC family transcriptional regulator [Acinetobacter lactucae]RSO58825.1 AraC family transcriptional regulator [Acinetobacter lactucae]
MSKIQDLIDVFKNLVKYEGIHSTLIEGIELMRLDHNLSPISVLQEPALVFMLQGQKRSYLGGEVFSFQQGQCLIVSVSLPFDCDTVASIEEPMLAIRMNLDADMVNELVNKAYFEHFDIKPLTTGMCVIEYDNEITEILMRILKLLSKQKKQDVLILGHQIKRELLYHVLQHSGADAIKGLIIKGNLRPIYKICDFLQNHYHEKITVDELAYQANMSISAFHKSFKKVTQLSPLQYLKVIRLHKAKQLLVSNQVNISEISSLVGYQNASQFSREFKKYFGVPPKKFEFVGDPNNDN